MSGTSMLLPFSLPEEQKCKGHKNYACWKINMIAHGRPRGLLNYWEDKIVIPNALKSAEEPEKGLPSPLAPINPMPTPVHSRTPSELEYELRKSIALSSILNLTDIAGSGVNPFSTSHAAWAFLEKQYGAGSQRMRNMRERELADCKYTDGSKVAGEGGHIEKMRKLHKAANDAGADVTDERFIVKLLDSFPES